MAHGERTDETPRGETTAPSHDDSLKPRSDGGPPRPATEPDGAESFTGGSETATDPSTGEPNPARR